jgi:hypothetical protein
MISFLSGLWGKVILVGAIVLAVAAVLFRQEYLGRMAERARAQEKQLNAAKVRNEIETTLRQAGPEELDKYLTHPSRRQ